MYDSWPARWFRGCGGCEEGFYDPEHNIEGYACYSDLKPGASLADILNMVVVHHEGDDQTYDVGKVQRKHIFGRGWVDIAYHFIVGRDGTLYEGRDIGVRGTHVIGQNSGKIGVLLLGDFQPGLRLPVVPIRVPDFRKGDDPGPTKAQVDSTLSLLRWLDYQYGIDEVRGHRDVEDQDTDCPGDSCMPWIPIFDEAVKEW